jgi:hypothetical protein
MKKITVIWTEHNHHSAVLEVPDDTDLSDPVVLDGLQQQGAELSGTFDGTDSITDISAEVSE